MAGSGWWLGVAALDASDEPCDGGGDEAHRGIALRDSGHDFGSGLA
jgi:hypothetical protein